MTSRVAQSVRGKLEAFYYAFGEDDVYAIVDASDNVAAATAAVFRCWATIRSTPRSAKAHCRHLLIRAGSCLKLAP